MHLAGGGAKGAAHIGVLKALREEDIHISYVSGTSSGSIIASLHAMGYSPEEMLIAFKHYCRKIVDWDLALPIKLLLSVFTGGLKVQGIAKGKKLEKFLISYAHKKGIHDISEIPIPIAIPTVEVKTGEINFFTNMKQNLTKQDRRLLYDDIPSYYNQGDVGCIIRASCSLPGIYVPKQLHDKYLVDGGIRLNSPVSVLREMGADKTIVVTFDINKNCKKSNENLLAIAMQSFDIMGHQINQEQLDSADMVIRPNLKDVSLLGCDKIEESITEGYRVTKKMMPKIKEMLSNNI